MCYYLSIVIYRPANVIIIIIIIIIIIKIIIIVRDIHSERGTGKPEISFLLLLDSTYIIDFFLWFLKLFF